MSLIVSCLTFLTFLTVVQSLSGTAQLTWYISYAPCCPENANYDSNADTTECVQYSACSYSGDFWAIGHKSFNYVQNTNLVAFFNPSDPNGDNFMTNYGGKEITLSKNGVTFTAIVADSCADSDCGGCCTTNSQPSGFLVDMEYWTAINNFGSTDDIHGQIQFTIGGTASTSSTSTSSTTTTSTNTPANDNIIITNQASTELYWVAFYITNVDLSCGGSITNVEITDNNHYSGTWIGYNDNQYGYYSFPNNGNGFTEPISVRITKSSGESIVAHDLISLTGDETFNVGSNFCVTSTTTTTTTNPTSSPSKIPTLQPSNNPSETPSIPSKFPTRFPTLKPTENPTLFPSNTNPTHAPTNNPTPAPTMNPTPAPTNNPTMKPTESPLGIDSPTRTPTNNTPKPTDTPSKMPSKMPTNIPSKIPTKNPIAGSPTQSPFVFETDAPTAITSIKPTMLPTQIPTNILYSTNVIYISTNDNDGNHNGYSYIGGKGYTSTELLIGSILLLGLIILITMVVICVCRKRKKKLHENSQFENTAEMIFTPNLKMIKNDDDLDGDVNTITQTNVVVSSEDNYDDDNNGLFMD